jgi:hypothetical protein
MSVGEDGHDGSKNFALVELVGRIGIGSKQLDGVRATEYLRGTDTGSGTGRIQTAIGRSTL